MKDSGQDYVWSYEDVSEELRTRRVSSTLQRPSRPNSAG